MFYLAKTWNTERSLLQCKSKVIGQNTMEIRWQLATSYDVIYAQINFRIQYFIKEIYKLVCVCMCDRGRESTHK